jgi:hypothetical protein
VSDQLVHAAADRRGPVQCPWPGRIFRFTTFVRDPVPAYCLLVGRAGLKPTTQGLEGRRSTALRGSGQLEVGNGCVFEIGWCSYSRTFATGGCDQSGCYQERDGSVCRAGSHAVAGRQCLLRGQRVTGGQNSCIDGPAEIGRDALVRFQVFVCDLGCGRLGCVRRACWRPGRQAHGGRSCRALICFGPPGRVDPQYRGATARVTQRPAAERGL